MNLTAWPGFQGPRGALGQSEQERAPAAEALPDLGPEWQCYHSGGAGIFDETSRRASHEELAVAKVLAGEGHYVRTAPERPGVRTPDLIACGTSVEVKSFRSLSERDGRPPSAGAVARKLLDARGQGALAVIWAGESGLSEATARAGYASFCQRALEHGMGKMRSVRMIGDGFDVSVRPAADLRSAPEARRRIAEARQHQARQPQAVASPLGEQLWRRSPGPPRLSA